MTAFLAGMWAACGMTALDWWTKAYHPSLLLERLLQVLALYLFVFAPAIVFVLDPPQGPTLMPRRLTEQFWKNYPRTIVRAACWLLGVGTLLLVAYLCQIGRQ